MTIVAPETLKVAHLDYEIRWYDRTEEDREKRYGYCDPNNVEIGLSERLDNPMKCETSIHEVLHAIWGVMNLPKKHEEKIVTSLGIGLAMLARDNPEFMKWWLSLAEAKRRNARHFCRAL